MSTNKRKERERIAEVYVQRTIRGVPLFHGDPPRPGPFCFAAPQESKDWVGYNLHRHLSGIGLDTRTWTARTAPSSTRDPLYSLLDSSHEPFGPI